MRETARRTNHGVGVMPEIGMYARVVHHGQETWHRDVIRVTGDDRYLTIYRSTHPRIVYCWIGGRDMRVLLCATSEDVTTALKEERASKYPVDPRD